MASGGGDSAVDPSSGSWGFTWGSNDDVVWLRNGAGEYRLIDDRLLGALCDLAAGRRSRDAFDADVTEAIDDLADAGYLRPDTPVEHVDTPDPIDLRPRLLAFAAVVCVLLAAGLVAWPVGVTDLYDSLGLLPFTVVFAAAVLVHEGGHYLASRPYFQPAIRPTRIAFVLPALVTRTNDAWRCPRSVRIWISLAGPFAEGVFGLALAGLAVLTSGDALWALVVLVLVRVVFALNPLIEGDGYWIVSDALGWVNLRTRGREDLYARRLTGRAVFYGCSVGFGLAVAGALLAYVGLLALSL